MYGTWLTMTMVLWLPSSLGLTSYPLLVWSVCTLTIIMCSQVYPGYKKVQKSYVWQCLERCHGSSSLGVSMNTVGWNEEEHQYTGMDGAEHTYVPTTQALRGTCKGEEEMIYKRKKSCKSC